jgi:hypothetical protein
VSKAAASPGRRTRSERGEYRLQLTFVVHSTPDSRRAALSAARLTPPLATRSPEAIPWHERPRDLASWSAKPAATEVVAHATLSLPQPERVVVGRVRPCGIEGVRIRLMHSGRRAEILRLATRTLKALRAPSIRSARAARGCRP